MNYKIPYNRKTTIRVEQREYQYIAYFSWNDGELDSLNDFDIPTVGEGDTQIEAIGLLIIEYDRQQNADKS